MAVAAQRLEQVALARQPRVRLATAKGRGRVPFALLSLAVIGVVLLGLVTAQTLVTQDSFRLSELTRRAERLEVGYGRLRLRAAELSSPDRLEQAARRAGLVLPELVELLPLPPVSPGATAGSEGTFAFKGVLGGTG